MSAEITQRSSIYEMVRDNLTERLKPHLTSSYPLYTTRMHEAQRRYRVLIERIWIRRLQASIIAGPKFKGAPIRRAVWLALEIPRGLNPCARNGQRYRTSVEIDGRIKGMKWPGMATSPPNIIPLPQIPRSTRIGNASVLSYLERRADVCRCPRPVYSHNIHAFSRTRSLSRAVYTRGVDRPWQIYTAGGCACWWYWIFYGRLNYTLPECWNRSTARTFIRDNDKCSLFSFPFLFPVVKLIMRNAIFFI